jgi:lipid II:glycine glycyltransferase (peptidoglycan interpeptide bridge formation enzyme)
VYALQPLEDPRWNGFVERHPRASVFHSSAWLQALYQTYGYEPIAFTTSAANQDLENGIVFCRVESWLTGRRMVSLPFSDHCEPLVEADDEAAIIAGILEQESEGKRWRYVELRPLQSVAVATPLRHTTVTYAFHQLDLSPDLDTLFRNFHKNSTQRKIRRAEREGLTYREGSTDALLQEFYGLFKLTRERHGVPPQPRKWFINLMKSFGDALKIRVAYQGDRPVAAMVTLRHKDTMVYKYGGSDTRFNNLGSMHSLYWRAIQDAKSAGLRYLDFGRTDAHQQSLITFKNRWGAKQSVLTYSRYGAAESSTHIFDLSMAKWKTRAARSVLSHLPSSVVSRIGQVLYRHIG